MGPLHLEDLPVAYVAARTSTASVVFGQVMSKSCFSQAILDCTGPGKARSEMITMWQTKASR